jgi:DNA-binding Xre family transcriptional regulator
MAKNTRKSKKDRNPGILRGRLRANILAVLDTLYPDESWGQQCSKLASATKVLSRSQIQRITVDPDDPRYKIEPVGVSIDTLEVLATALDVTPSDLLSAHFKPHDELRARARPSDGPKPRPFRPAPLQPKT